jgi:hypothetical protein
MSQFTEMLPSGTLATTKAGLAVGTTTTLTTANTQLYSIKGISYTKAGVSNEATPTLDSNTGVAFTAIPVGYGGVFAICRDSSGSLKAVQGMTIALDSSNAFINRPQLPSVPDTLCPIGNVTVKVGTTGSAWTFGVSNFSGPPTGVVFVFNDWAGGMPDRPVA